jgi:bacteriocin-like protein
MKEERTEINELSIEQMEQVSGGSGCEYKKGYVTRFCKTCNFDRVVLEVNNNNEISYVCIACGNDPDQ